MRSIRLFETVGVISAFLSGASWASDDLFLFGAVRDQPYGYYVAWSALASKVAWAPEKGPFPVALDREAKRAEHYLARENGITNELDLIAIDIHRLVTPRHLLEKRGLQAAQFTNQWQIRYIFDVRGPTSGFRQVVMLLDGTIATERPFSITSPNAIATPDQGRTKGLSGTEPPTVARSAAGFPTGLHKDLDANQDYLESESFLVPAVQWDPRRSRFPLELSEACSIAKRWLLTEREVSSEVVPQEIHIFRYQAPSSLRASAEQLDLERHHWVVVVRHGLARHSGYHYSTHILLDGRVMQVTAVDMDAPPHRHE